MPKAFAHYRIFKQTDGTFATTFDTAVYSSIVEARRSLSLLRDRLRSARTRSKRIPAADFDAHPTCPSAEAQQENSAHVFLRNL